MKKKLSSLWVVLTMHHWVAQQGMRTGDIVIVIIIFNIVIIISLLLITYHRRFQRLWMKQYFINTRIKKLPKNTIALLHITKQVMRITDVQFHKNALGCQDYLQEFEIVPGLIIAITKTITKTIMMAAKWQNLNKNRTMMFKTRCSSGFLCGSSRQVDARVGGGQG